MKFLFLGNDTALSLINWDLVRSSSLFVVGINRSHMLYKDHDILFIQDPKPILELLDQGATDEYLKQLNIHTTRYFRRRMTIEKTKGGHTRISKQEYQTLLDLLQRKVIKTVETVGPIKHHTPYSILAAMSYCYNLFEEAIKEAGGCTYYLYGCSLKHVENNNHFWQNSDVVRFPDNSSGGSSKKQLARQVVAMNNLKPILLAHKVRIVSCNEFSRLNVIFPHEPLNNVLLKNQKIHNE